MGSPPIAGAIDIGSNSILLGIARPGREKPIPLDVIVDQAEVTGLSKGISKTGNISEERLQKSLSVLRHYRKLLDEHHVEKFQVVGTEAFRKAKNGEQAKSAIEQILRA